MKCPVMSYEMSWGWCTGTTQRDGMGREEGSGWGTHVYLWRIHFDIWQNQYNTVKLKNKIKLKKKKETSIIHKTAMCCAVLSCSVVFDSF